MNEMIDVRGARHVRDHILHLEFNDGVEGEVDLSSYPHRGPIFLPLADVAFFAAFSLEGGTVAWPNGADIAPERLYELTKEASQPVQRTASGGR